MHYGALKRVVPIGTTLGTHWRRIGVALRARRWHRDRIKAALGAHCGVIGGALEVMGDASVVIWEAFGVIGDAFGAQ